MCVCVYVYSCIHLLIYCSRCSPWCFKPSPRCMRRASTSIASINAAAPKDLILAVLHLGVRESNRLFPAAFKVARTKHRLEISIGSQMLDEPCPKLR